MMDSVFTERQYREREFYQEYSKRQGALEVCFDPITSASRRPWNSYWHLIDRVIEHFQTPDQRLLDFGCGSGEYSVLYSKIGYEVFGFDISPTNILQAQERAEKYGFAERTHFSVSVAEDLDYPSNYFDIIVGVDILHHVDIQKAISECFRILKKGGIAIFHEPVRVPLLDFLRETPLGLALVPRTVSYEKHLTQDERKLTRNDLAILRKTDPKLRLQRFLLSTRLSRFINNENAKPMLEKFDRHMFTLVPMLQAYGGVVVATLHKS